MSPDADNGPVSIDVAENVAVALTFQICMALLETALKKLGYEGLTIH